MSARTTPATMVCVRVMRSSGGQSIATRLQSGRIMRSLVVFIFVAAIAVPRVASAQTDEIQVYDGGLAPPGVFNLTLHSNFTPRGVKTPAFPGAVVADQ